MVRCKQEPTGVSEAQTFSLFVVVLRHLYTKYEVGLHPVAYLGVLALGASNYNDRPLQKL